MRLVCPNCEAKYEVPADAIPETGRDVQCANCGHAWYQMRTRSAAAETVAAPVVPPSLAPAPVVEPEPESVIEIADEASVEVAEKAAAEAEAPVVPPPSDGTPEDLAEEPVADEVSAVEASDVEEAADATRAEDMVAGVVVADAAQGAEASDLAVGAVPVAYAVDDSVLAILREEAEREAMARRAEVAKPLETQTDLGIEAAIPETRKPAEVVARVAAAVEGEADDKLANRRPRLPDVEEINSTLRRSESGQNGAVDALSLAGEGRSSFRSGFLLVLSVAILGVAVYGAADAITSVVPALTGPLKAYVGFVDSLRLHLDGLMQSATAAINGN